MPSCPLSYYTVCMPASPFPLLRHSRSRTTWLRPFADRLHIALFTKEDGNISFAKAATAIGAKNFATLNQIHGNRTIRVTHPFDRTEDADGMITDVPNLALIVRAADCQMFVIVAPEQHVIGTLHVGWRGLVAGAIPEFFRALDEHWHITPAETYVVAGPSLCMQCAEFTDPPRELPQLSTRFIRGRHVDLRAAADAELHALGIPSAHRERNSDCTCCRSQAYWTWRGGDRDAVKAGHTNLLACTLTPVLA